MSKLEERPRADDPRGHQPGRRRSRATTSSSATGRWSRRVRREGADWAEDEATRARRDLRPRRRDRAGRSGEREPAPASHPRPLRQPHRRGRVPPRLARADAARDLARASTPRRGASPSPGAHVARAAQFMLLSQVEAGVGCPISMTYSVIPAIRKQPELAEEWEPRFLSLAYDGERLVPAPDKKGALCGMAMTEKQGGSDVRANTTVADAAERRRRRAPSTRSPATSGSARRRCATRSSSSPRPRAGSRASCMPRFTPDGERNAFHIQRLKDKLGNRSNASSEVEFRGAWARLVGEEGRGVPDDHRDGQPHPARLRDRVSAGYPLGNRRWRSTTRATAPPSASAWSTSR